MVTADGGVAIGYTWGLSIRLGDVRMGAPTKNMTVFLNISKVFLGSTQAAAGSSAATTSSASQSLQGRKGEFEFLLARRFMPL